MKQYIFGYGSLINPASLGRTLGRVVDPTELRPACLRGYQRFWGLVDTVFSTSLDQSVQAVFLDVRPIATSQCNGIVVPVSGNEFAALLLRERNYNQVDITDQLVAPPSDGRVTVFAGRPEHQIGPASPNCYVMQRYVDLIHAGVGLLGTDFSTQFWLDTLPHQFPVLNGPYSFG